MNLAKTRATGRGGAYGELLMLHPGGGGATTATIPVSAYRYTPYPLPTVATAGVTPHHHASHHHPHHQATIPTAAAALAAAAAAGLGTLSTQPTATVVPLAGHSAGLLHYSPASHAVATAAALYDMSCKRALAALRPATARPPANTLTYSMNDLLNVSGLELTPAGAYTMNIPATMNL